MVYKTFFLWGLWACFSVFALCAQENAEESRPSFDGSQNASPGGGSTVTQSVSNPLHTTILKESDFVIKDIHVDITASSAQEARTKAIAQAQRQAFRKLLENLVPAQNRAALESLSDEDLENLVQDFEMTKERYSNVRYLATMVVSFKPADVSALFEKASVDVEKTLDQKEQSSSLTQKKSDFSVYPVVVVPVFLSSYENLLWEEKNPWKQALQSLMGQDDRYIVPMGDLKDISDLPVGAAQGGSLISLSKVRERYEAPRIVVAVFNNRVESDPSLQLFSYGVQGLENKTPVIGLGQSQNISGQEKTLFESAYDKIISFIQNGVYRDEKQAHIQPHLLRASFHTFKEWLSLKNRLETVPGVHHLEILSLNRSGAQVRLSTSHKPSVLGKVFSQAGILIKEKTGEFEVTLSNHLDENSYGDQGSSDGAHEGEFLVFNSKEASREKAGVQ